ncbi:MAG: hypothetical protein ACRCY3_13590 [Sphingorhabdus sp.]
MSNSRFLFSSVVRGAFQGESHGGLYVVDFENKTAEQLFDHNSGAIDFEGRGADRGLRGIAIRGDDIFVAASDEIFIFTPDMKIKGSLTNPYLKHAHEICLTEHGLFVTSTGFDSILLFDVDTRKAIWGLHIIHGRDGVAAARSFDPSDIHRGPPRQNACHINMISFRDESLFFSGLRLDGLYRFNTGAGCAKFAEIPCGTHNAQPWQDGVIFNNTAADELVFATRDRMTAIPVPRYERDELDWTSVKNDQVARPHFGRGLCVMENGTAVGGSSPSTLALYDFGSGQMVAAVQAMKDVRSAVHGIHAWPF